MPKFPYLKQVHKDYQADFYKRFRTLKGLILKSVVDNDCFRLTSKPRVVLSAHAQALRAPFEFKENPEKVKMFMAWLRQAQDEHLLEVTERTGREVVAHSQWQNLYVRRSYEKGIEFAKFKLEEAGIDMPEEDIRAIFNRPVHADSLGMLYSRNFTELEGITEAMDQQISRELANGLSQGMGPREIARNINNRVDKIGLTRARTLARTEVNRTQNEASLNRYSDYGVEEVEWLAGAGACPICAAAEGSIYKRDEARGILPEHANCRCTWAPVVKR